MLSDKMIYSISQQIKKEYESAYMYLEVADFYENQGLMGFANWFIVQAQEEMDHGMIFYEYLHSNNSSAQFFNIEPSGAKFQDLKDPLKDSLKHEEFITDSINRIYELACKENDYRTKEFLNWFIIEQQEEEQEARGLLDKMMLFGENPASLFQLDKQCMRRQYSRTNKLRNSGA